MRIACVHSAEVNTALFATEAARLFSSYGERVHVTHDLSAAPHLLAAEAAGGLNADIAEATAEILERLAAESNVVLLTCTTLAPATEIAGRRTQTPVLRVDAALAEAACAAAAGKRMLVLYAVATTLEPTRALFEATNAGRATVIDYRLVEGAWPLMRAGDLKGYHRLIAAVADEASDREHSPDASPAYDIVVLAQSSMAGATAFMNTPPALTSPAAGLAAAMASVQRAGCKF